MIKSIIRFSAENRILVIAATLVALAFSFWTMQNIPLDALPDMSRGRAWLKAHGKELMAYGLE